MTIFQLKTPMALALTAQGSLNRWRQWQGKMFLPWLPLITGVHDLLIKLPVKCKLSPAIVVPLPLAKHQGY